MDKDKLSEYVEQGLSIRKIAEEFNCSYSNIRHWLGKHELKTTYERSFIPIEDREASKMKFCTLHNKEMLFVLRSNGRYVCKECHSKSASQRRSDKKNKFKAAYGGCCSDCGYEENWNALEFHHIDPAVKLIELSRIWTSTEKAKAEAEKCKLLCRNCHSIEEYGYEPLSLITGRIIQNEFGQHECELHGAESLYIDKSNKPICRICRSIKIRKLRYEEQRKYTAFFDHKCFCCTFNQSIYALDFHHLVPSDKVVEVSRYTWTKKDAHLILEEVKKCILLCKNCHRSVEDSLIILPVKRLLEKNKSLELPIEIKVINPNNLCSTEGCDALTRSSVCLKRNWMFG